jgi:putative Ca2+/H+ antiporter (TMEM165/GDT1 family)
LVAVGLGTAASFLPETVVHVAASVMFLIGAIILVREARAHEATEGQEEEDFAAQAGEAQGFKVIVTSFLVLFAAEWGDLSQLLTLSLVAKYDDPVSVFLGAWGALLAVSGLAVVVGRVLLMRIRLSRLHYLGAGVCVLMACLTVWEMTR